MVFLFGTETIPHGGDASTFSSKEQELSRYYYEKWRTIPDRNSGSSVPQFYRRVVPVSDNDLQFRLLEEARGMSLSKLNSKILDNDEIQEIWNLFQQQAQARSNVEGFIGGILLLSIVRSGSLDSTKLLKAAGLVVAQLGNNQTKGFISRVGSNSQDAVDQEKPQSKQYLSYTSYSAIRRMVSSKIQAYLRPCTFLSLICTEQIDQPDLVRIADLFNYIVRKVWLERTRLALSLYDLEGHGFLKEADLEQYIEELIPTIETLSVMEAEFKKFYVCSVLRKFFFFLDPGRQGKIRIIKMLGSTLMQELMDVRETPSDKSAKKNWFTLEASLEVYNDYLSLDRKRNGLLSKEEFRQYPKASLTEAFVQRVYEECLTYEGEMDYKTFLDVVLALTNKHESPAIRFLFRILDVGQRGVIDGQTVSFFFRDIQKLLAEDGIHAPSFTDVAAEIFDMVPSRIYGQITLQELIDSRLGGTIVGLLIDKDCFLAYEFREQQLTSPT